MDRSWVVLAVLVAALTTLTTAALQYDLTWLPALAAYLPSNLGFHDSVKPLATFANKSEDWNLLHHLGGNGPWIPKTTNVVDGGIDAPAGCRIEQIHMVGRCRRIEMSTKLSTTRYPDMLSATQQSKLVYVSSV